MISFFLSRTFKGLYTKTNCN